MFTHLHVHTEYSLLDGSNKIKEYVARVKELGMEACAITDHGAMYGCIDFYKECRKQGIKPILGCEVYVAPGSRFERERRGGEERYYHLILLAENEEGFANLGKIVSAGFTEGFYYKPRVDKEILREYHEGLICTSACLAGEVAHAINKGDPAWARKAALEYRDIFGADNYFLELQDHGLPEQKRVNRELLRISREEGIPLICTNDCHYTFKEDADAHDILLCIQTGKRVTDENRMRYEGGQYYVKSEEEMAALFPECPQALENTNAIAKRCNVEIRFGERKLPHFDVPAGYTPEGYLRKLCEDGLYERYGDPGPEERERLDYELSTIQSMGFTDYFLIVWDYVRFARDNGIAVGPGRGSAAGSVVSYTLGITDLDPLKYGLIFERFLNPERVTMPDIDMDFCFERRQEVIDYVVRKYGRECVCQIITFGTMQARGAIRDVARALDFPYAKSDALAKMVPRELGITLDGALSMNPELKKEYDGDEEIHFLIDMARRLEGLPRNSSTHAAGVVICGRPVVDYVPVARSADETIVTQYTMTTLEELGLLKMDFLGLRTLTVIQDAVFQVNAAKAPGEEPLDLRNIDYNDPAVMEMIGKGKCEGVFQLESAGMKAFMKQLKPRTLEDIIAGISLYRPGPMDFIPKYLAGKEDPASITYDCPEMEPILKNTYGCIVYQEQVMQIVRDLGGYSFGRSDMVRRAMSKKKADVMEKERQNFVYGNEAEGIPGCVSKGIDAGVADHIFNEMTDFANYAFNKSHAAAYAVVSFRTAYLKHYYPVEFMAALLTSVIDSPDKCAEYLRHCRDMGIEILQPSVNDGFGKFTVEDGKIRFGMNAVRGVGKAVADNVVKERQAGGPFRSMADFADRMYERDGNKRVLENLIKAGALDCLPGNRQQKLLGSAQALNEAQASHKKTFAGQYSLFDFAGEAEKAKLVTPLPDKDEFPKEQILAFEFEVLGVYLSGHPLDMYRKVIEGVADADAADFAPDEETGLPRIADGKRVRLAGMVTSSVLKFTKNNSAMSFVTLEDMTGSAEIIFFPKTHEKYRDLAREGEKIFVEGRVSAEEDRPSKLVADRVEPFSQLPQQLWIAFENEAAFAEQKPLLDELIESAGQGRGSVFAFLKDTKKYKRVSKRRIAVDEGILDMLRDACGNANVALRADKW